MNVHDFSIWLPFSKQILYMNEWRNHDAALLDLRASKLYSLFYFNEHRKKMYRLRAWLQCTECAGEPKREREQRNFIMATSLSDLCGYSPVSVALTAGDIPGVNFSESHAVC